jgi:hypothetical protein
MKHHEEIIWNFLQQVGTSTKWCVDLGALDGYRHSNTHGLITEKGWNGVLIEANPLYFEKLQRLYKDNPRAHCFNEYVSFEGVTLESILERTEIPRVFDYLSIDIDGADYFVWESLKNYTPKLVEIEFNPSFPNDISFVQPRDMSVFQGSSLRALTELASNKNYQLLAVVDDVNALFGHKDYLPKHIAEKSIDEVNTGTSYQTRLIQLYDGTILLDGRTDYIWHKKPITIPSLNKYPARVSSKKWLRTLKYYYHKLRQR